MPRFIDHDGCVHPVHASAAPTRREALYGALAMLAFCILVGGTLLWGCWR